MTATLTRRSPFAEGPDVEDQARNLEHAICNLIQTAKQIPALAVAKFAVMGDLALWHYLDSNPPADEIELVTDIPYLCSLKEKLLGHPNSPFILRGETLFYRSPGGRDIKIKVHSQWKSPRLPEPEQLVSNIPYGEVPYISIAGLIDYKIVSRWAETASEQQRKLDKRDAVALINQERKREALGQRNGEVRDRNFQWYESRVRGSLLRRCEKRQAELLELHSRQRQGEEPPVIETEGAETDDDIQSAMSRFVQTLPPDEVEEVETETPRSQETAKNGNKFSYPRAAA